VRLSIERWANEEHTVTDWLRDDRSGVGNDSVATAITVDLTGRRVLVTGASSGIGAATCRAIVACGGSVAMLARRKERLDELCGQLGSTAVGFPCDVTDLAALERAVSNAADALDGLDGVVAVAGQTMAGSIVSGVPEQWRSLVDLNLVGPLATVHYALKWFGATGRRDVVLMGSAGAITPLPATAIYGATKRGLRAAYESLRLELARAGINVSIVMPGMIDTEGLTLDSIVIDGEPPVDETPMFAADTGPASPASVASSIAFMMSLPEGIAINELVLRPTGQLNP
jgi:NADP-dependent 3-hydroxy acid dehydrogenase YdfG